MHSLAVSDVDRKGRVGLAGVLFRRKKSQEIIQEQGDVQHAHSLAASDVDRQGRVAGRVVLTEPV